MNLGHKATQSQEHVLRSTHPHIVGMYPLYLIWLYFTGIGTLWMAKRAEWVPVIAGKLNSMLDSAGHVACLNHAFGLGDRIAANNQAYLAVWLAALVIPGVIIAVGRIRFKWLLVVGGAMALGIYLKEFSPLGDRNSPMFVNNIENVVLIGLGTIGIIGTEFYRRCHDYVLTDRRIIIRAGGPGSRERSIFYGRIDDLVLDKPLLGAIFGFGTIIPITSSGLGVGSNLAGGAATVGGRAAGATVGLSVMGAQSENVTRASLGQTLYNVPHPEEIYELIADQVGQRAA